MPYNNVSDALKTQPGLKKYSDKAKRTWVKVFNSCFKEGKPESRCFAEAYAVANKIDKKKKSSSKEETWEESARLANQRRAHQGNC